MKSKWGPLVLGACVVVLFFVALSNIGVVWSIFKFIFRVLLPIIIGAGIAYILNPFTKFYDRTIFKRLKKRKVAWGLSLVLTLIVLLALIFLLLYSLIPQMMEIVDRWQLPSSDWIESIKGIISSEGGLIEKALQLLIDNIGVIISRSSTFTAGTVNWGIGFILAIYFLADKRRVTGFLKKLLEMFTKPEHYNNVLTVGHKFNTIFAKFISVELIDALIVGVLNYIFMLILGMPYALVTSVVVGIANLVPTFGPIVGGVVGALIQLLANPINALWFIIFTIALQTFDGYWIKPRMFGEFLNVPGVLILISIVVFGRLIGIVGVFLAIPLAAIMIYLFNEFALPRMEARKEHKQKDAPPQS